MEPLHKFHVTVTTRWSLTRMTGTEGRLRSSVKKQVSGITLQLREDQQGKEGQTQQSTENKTLPEKEPSFISLPPLLGSFLRQRVFRSQSGRLKVCCKSTSPLPVPQPHTRDTLPHEKDSVCYPCYRGDSGQPTLTQRTTGELSHLFLQITLPSW